MANETDEDISLLFPFCVHGLDNFHTFFHSIHFKLSLCICIFGSITNVLNFIILLKMRSHINYILSAIAVSDFFVMVIFIPYSLDYGFDLNSKYERLTKSYATYIYAHAAITSIAHTISIFLTVMLAFWRYISVCHPNLRNHFMRRTVLIIAINFIIPLLVNIPILYSMSIKPTVKLFNETDGSLNQTVTIYQVWPSEFALKHEKAYLWIYAVAIKLLPCIALTYLSCQLIGALFEAKRRKAKLLCGSSNMSANLLSKKKQGDKAADKTTRLLLAVLILFLITEFPQGIFGLLSACLHEHFYYHCYQKLGDLFDFLALLNSSINFILYCVMSRQFRETFAKCFVPKLFQSITKTNGMIELTSRNVNDTIEDTRMSQL